MPMDWGLVGVGYDSICPRDSHAHCSLDDFVSLILDHSYDVPFLAQVFSRPVSAGPLFRPRSTPKPEVMPEQMAFKIAALMVANMQTGPWILQASRS